MRLAAAFTLLEIMLVIVLIGAVTAFFLPRLVQRSPTLDWSHVLDEMNNLVSFARQEAIANQIEYRLLFVQQPKKPATILIEKEQLDAQDKKRKIFVVITSDYAPTKYTLPEEIVIDGVFDGKTEQLAHYKNRAYCYIVPDGLVQDILIHLTRNSKGVVSEVSLRMKPFYGMFELVQGHSRPG